MLESYKLILEQYSLWNNSAWEYAIAGAVFLGLLLLLKLFQLVLLGKLKKLAKNTKSDIDDVLLDVIGHVKPFFYILVSLFVSAQTLELHSIIAKIIDLLFYVALIAEAIAIVEAIATYGMKQYLKKREEDNANQKAMVNMALVFIRISLWSLGFLFILSNLGVNISSLIASLGIGGIAIAFALQNLLSDIFSSFSILFDKPFSIGDFIVVGKDSGTVEKIGLKTTRIRTLRGEEMVIPNKDLTSARVQNLKTMERRRELLNFSVEYGTTTTKLEKIPGIVQKIVESNKDATFDRCHLVSLGDSSLDFESVYYIENAEYDVYLDTKQNVNLSLLEALDGEGIVLAYPTQTIHLQK